jgi:hypothetical protein
MSSLKQALDDRGLLASIVLPPLIDQLLDALQPTVAVPAGGDVRGSVQLAVKKSLGVLALDLSPPGPAIPYHLVSDQAAGTFRLWLILSDAPPAKKLFSFATGAAGAVLTAASAHADGKEEWLEPAGGDVAIVGAAVTLLIEGRSGEIATLSLSPTDGQPRGIVVLGLEPPQVLLGTSGFGLALPNGFVIDDSSDAAPPGQTTLNGEVVVVKSDDPAWRGLAVRQARFFLPRGVPFLGGHAVDSFVEVGLAAGEGIDLGIATRVPPTADRPGIDVRIECRDPTATGLQDFLPTLVEAAMELPFDPAHDDKLPGNGFNLAAGKPVIVRLRFARSVADPQTRLTLAVEAQGPNGIVSVVAPDGGPAARIVIGASALATAIVADKAPPGADASGVVLHDLLVAALGLTAFLKDKGRVTVHKAELASEGHGLPVGGAVKLTIDYSVDVLVKPIGVGALEVKMRDEQPMRVRNRNVGLTIDPTGGGLGMFKLDFSAADMEIEDPGGWQVDSPGSLFDILGTRSGRGSTWLEVDLRFKLNLGPIRISGATIRATLETNGSFSASLRGLDAGIAVPGAIDGEGKLQLLKDGGFEAELEARLLPLNLAVDAEFLYQTIGDSFALMLGVGVDLPGPIPIANTGLGLFGIAGAFGINARPRLPAPDNPDPIGYQLAWDASRFGDLTAPDSSYEFARNDLTIGAEVVLGTAPDLGFTFSTKGGIVLTVPDLAIRGALWAKLMSPRLRVSDHPSGADIGLSFQGVVVIDGKDGITIGLKGTLRVPVLLEAVIPLGAHFPFGPNEADNWYIYLGSDGYRDAVPSDGRGLGPMRATILPGILDEGADAYVMLRGHGIQKWPRGGPVTINDGFVIAFGFGFEVVMGLKPIAWAEVHASADILIATCPLTLAGFGAVGGSLNLGPFSIGVDATLDFQFVEDSTHYIHARVCGHIDLFFTDIEGCVEISVGNLPTPAVPPPDTHPLDRVENGVVAGDLAFLIDDRYRRIGFMQRTPENIAATDHVWPDTLLHLSFAVSPKLAPDYVAQAPANTPQFDPIATYPTGLAAEPVGNDMLHYEWTLTNLALFDVTDNANSVLVPGKMSAAWQVGKDGDIGTRPQAGDLVLLTYQGDLIINRLADAGAGLPHDPLDDTANRCHRRSVAVLGWAIGFEAAPVGNAFLLPADPLSPDPCVSRFTAMLTPFASPLGKLALGLSSAALLPPPLDFTPAFIEAFAAPQKLEREFDGALDLGVVGSDSLTAERIPAAQSAQLVASDTLTSARLWLLVEGKLDGDPQPLVIKDDRNVSWFIKERRPLPDGRAALRWEPTTPGPVHTVFLVWLPRLKIAVLGLGGITAAAQAAADLRNAANQAESDRQKDAAQNQPQPPDETKGSGVRCLLEPGRLYRLDVGMSWEGSLFRQDENGNKVEAAHAPPSTTYRPKGLGDTDTGRSFFFRTTEKPIAGGPGAISLIPDYGQPERVKAIVRRQDLFEPAMLARHLIGYTPAQAETARFCDDPVSAHFSAAHVTTLAAQYGFDLKLGLRRVDAPGAAGQALVLDPIWKVLTAPQFLVGADRRRYDVASTAHCPMPKPGGTLEALHPLATRAWYEVYALAKSTNVNVFDGRLDGVTFQTSRWRIPADMLSGLGFRSPASHPTGDIEIAHVPVLDPAVRDGEDTAFEQALDALGLDGWPAATEPRVSIIWLRKDAAGGPSWLCAGLLLESPEPIHRPGRCELASLRVVMRPAPAGVFDIRRSDRTHARYLFICSAPFAPHASRIGVGIPTRFIQPTIALDLKDVTANTLLTGSVQLSLHPSFAQEA